MGYGKVAPAPVRCCAWAAPRANINNPAAKKIFFTNRSLAGFTPRLILYCNCYWRLNRTRFVPGKPENSRFGPIPPLFSQSLVCQHFDVHAAYHGPRLEALLLAGGGVVPVGERNTARALVDPAADGLEESIPVGRVFGQGGGPYLPVELGVGSAVVERQPVAVQVLEIEGDLGLAHTRREEAEPEDLVPYQVVLLAPGAGLVEGEPVMVCHPTNQRPVAGDPCVSVPCHRLPFFCHLTRQVLVLVGEGSIPCAAGHLGKSGEALDGLDGEIGIVRKMTGEVVGGELVGRVQTLVFQILRPFLELWPVLPCEVPVAQFVLHGGNKDEQVSALLDGHLVVLGAFAAAIHLAVGQRIGAEVVRRKGPLPAWEGCVLHDRLELCFKERGIEEEEKGS